MIITLVGYRGTGKSSIAPALAARLRWKAVDADEEIERRAGCSIREVFRRQGEAEFRRLERDVIAELLHGDQLVLAAGGGAILDSHTRRELHAAGPVIWLKASVSTILTRMEADAASFERRPALTSRDPRTEVETLLAIREPLYREVAMFTVETDERAPQEIVEEIVQLLPAGPAEDPA